MLLRVVNLLVNLVFFFFLFLLKWRFFSMIILLLLVFVMSDFVCLLIVFVVKCIFVDMSLFNCFVIGVRLNFVLFFFFLGWLRWFISISLLFWLMIDLIEGIVIWIWWLFVMICWLLSGMLKLICIKMYFFVILIWLIDCFVIVFLF